MLNQSVIQTIKTMCDIILYIMKKLIYWADAKFSPGMTPLY